MWLPKRSTAAILAATLSIQATGCATWKAVNEPLPAAVVRYPDRKMKVLLQDGRTIEADSVKPGTDALLSYGRAKVDTIPLSQVQSVRVHQGNTGGTVALTIGIIAGLLTIYVLVGLLTMDDN